ncbi:MAG: prephenate dehydrogenase/arogenate dehydrogenase family protein, partial [Thermoproteota archaeon]
LGLPVVAPGASCEWIECAVLSVPPRKVEGVALEYAPLLGEDCLLVDVSSVKTPVLGFIRSSRRPVLSIHPLFGPTTESLEGKSVAVVHPARLEGRSKEFVDSFKKAGAKVVFCSPKEHDAAVPYTLALPHLLAALYGSLLAESGIRPGTLERLGGSSFRAMSSLAKSVGSESPEVYASIQLASPSYDETLGLALGKLRAVRKGLREGDAGAFLRLMRDSSSLPFARRIQTAKTF